MQDKNLKTSTLRKHLEVRVQVSCDVQHALTVCALPASRGNMLMWEELC